MKHSHIKKAILFLILAALAFSPIGTSKAFASLTDFTNLTTANGLGSNNVISVFVSGGKIYAATDGGLSISSDGGATFINKTTGDGLGSNTIFDVYVSGDTVFAATSNGLSISTNGGNTFIANKTTVDGLGDNQINNIAVSGNMVYAATMGGLGVSTNGGISFSNKTTANGLGHDIALSVFVSGNNVYAGTWAGLSLSSDGGNTFYANRTTANGLPINGTLGVFAEGNTVYAATAAGLGISTNGGSTFISKTNANSGLGTNPVSVLVSGNTIYVSTNTGLSISTDGGSSFINKTTANGLGSNDVNRVFINGSTIYVCTSGGLSLAQNPVAMTSVAAQDGWVLETSESANTGGSINASATTLRLGDDATKKQYRAILSFDTAGLPDNAVITKVTLKVKQQAIVGGGDPVATFQGFMVDIKKGFFGTTALQVGDFQSAANKTYGPFNSPAVSGWYAITLTPAKSYVNKLTTNGGLTQIRLRFKTATDNNAIANYLSLFSGNAGAASRPQLIIEYYVP